MSTKIIRSAKNAGASDGVRVRQREDGCIDWLLAVDQIKLRDGLIEDKDVANTLLVPVSTFSEFRNATGNLPWLAKLRVLHMLGFELLSEAIDLLSQEEAAEKSRRKLQRQARKTSAAVDRGE